MALRDVEKRTAIVGVFGFALWGVVVFVCAAGAMLLALRSGWSPRLWPLLGCPAGVACAWLFARGTGRRWPLRYGPAGVAAGTVVAVALASSAGTGSLMLSFAAGFFGAPLFIFLRQMISGARSSAR